MIQPCGTSIVRITTILIVVHGSGRNPDYDLCCGDVAAMMYAPNSSDTNTTLVIAPWFLAPGDVVPLPPSDTTTTQCDDEICNYLRWDQYYPIAHTWRYGADSVVGNISAMHAEVEYLLFASSFSSNDDPTSSSSSSKNNRSGNNVTFRFFAAHCSGGSFRGWLIHTTMGTLVQ